MYVCMYAWKDRFGAYSTHVHSHYFPLSVYRDIADEEAACSHIPPPQLPPRLTLSNGAGAEMPQHSPVGKLNIQNGSSSDTDEDPGGRSSWSPVASHRVCTPFLYIAALSPLPCITPFVFTPLFHLHTRCFPPMFHIYSRTSL